MGQGLITFKYGALFKSMAPIITVILSMTAGLLTGCQWSEQKKNSILLIAVDSLGVNQVPCLESQSPQESGFYILCQESVRFTHAYTPSVLAQPALVSILTGKYPQEHRVWHNGSQFLSAQVKSLPERYLSAGYRTSFFSGGPPIWSFSGLNQGYEKFFDHWDVSLKSLYTPSTELFTQFSSWLESIEDEEAFFTTLFLADPQFKNIETYSRSGEVREVSFASQIKAIDESLFSLIKDLTEKKRWDSTHIILTGLNGITNSQHLEELKGFNLLSSNSQVALLIKPAQRKRDLGLQWKIDRNVSLVDLGKTFEDWLEPNSSINSPSSETAFPSFSLTPVLQGPTAKWPQDRKILTESAWGQMLDLAASRFSLRARHWLYLHDQTPKIYNTLVDSFETSPLAEATPLTAKFSQQAQTLFFEKGYENWRRPPASFVQKHFLSSQLWEKYPPSKSLKSQLSFLQKKTIDDEQLLHWLGWLSLKEQNWQEFEYLAKRSQNSDWLYLSERALQKRTAPPQNDCLALLDQLKTLRERPSPKTCDDALFVELVLWLGQTKQSPGKAMVPPFYRLYRWKLIRERIAQVNALNHLVWPVDHETFHKLTYTDMVLALPEFSRQRRQLERWLEKH